MSVPFARILVPVDGSPCSDAAVGYALRLASGRGELFFANVLDLAGVLGAVGAPYGGDPSILLAALRNERQSTFANACARAHANGVVAHTLELEGSPIDEIVAQIPRVNADAIVMGTHGRRGLARATLGSVAAGVLRRSGVPTFVVHEHLALPGTGFPIRRVLAARKDAHAAGSAARLAADLAAAYGAEAIGAHAHERHTAEDIIAIAAREHADLIAIGTHGPGGPGRLVLGSVVERVVEISPIPVVTVRTADVRESEAVR